MSTKIRYEIDPYNRLVVIDKSLSLPKQRRVIEGRFAIGGGNSLEYRVKSPVSESEETPYQLQLKGAWSLSPGHDLVFSVKKSSGGASGNSLAISGNIIDTKGDAILFSVTTKRGERAANTYALEIAGTWAVDLNNRLIFRVNRDNGRYDPLVFEARWEVNKDNEIVYRYERAVLKTRRKTIHTLILRGQWGIGQNGLLRYEMDALSGSSLSFRASICGCGENYIKYEIGAGLSDSVKPHKRTITLFGAWRLKKGSGLFFDIESSRGKLSSISLTVEAKLTSRDTVLFTIKDGIDGKGAGVRFELNRIFLKGDGSAFVRILHSREASGVLVGAGFRW